MIYPPGCYVKTKKEKNLRDNEKREFLRFCILNVPLTGVDVDDLSSVNSTKNLTYQTLLQKNIGVQAPNWQFSRAPNLKYYEVAHNIMPIFPYSTLPKGGPLP